MKEISLNVLDICENSTKAGASLVTVTVDAQPEANTLTVCIEDNGCGMSKEFLSHVEDPFTTTRTTRPIGMGIPLFKQAAEAANGSFNIRSEQSAGTTVTAVFELDHIDRMPVGDMATTISSLIQCNEQCDFLYIYRVGDERFELDTRWLRKELEGVPLSSAEVVLWIRDYINDNMRIINGGRQL